jgi:hypothetical protein
MRRLLSLLLWSLLIGAALAAALALTLLAPIDLD